MTMNLVSTNDFYRTSDLALVATLCVLGFVVEEVENGNFQRSIFLLSNSARLKKTVNQYWRGKLKVEPQAYFNQLKILKTRIYRR